MLGFDLQTGENHQVFSKVVEYLVTYSLENGLWKDGLCKL